MPSIFLNSKNEQKPSVPVTNRSTTEILPPDYSIAEPSGQMQKVPVATAEPVSDQLPPDFPPPPEEEFSGSNEMPEIPPSAPVEETQVMTRQRSPYEAFEIALLRYVVRYGERVLYDYVDEETKERIVMRVAEFIRDDLERDDLSFYTPIFKQMLDEAANRCGEETFIAHRYFLSHPDPLVSRVAANLMSEKYQLSKYHFKFREVEQEEDKLDQLVVRDLFAFKEAYIMRQLKEKQEQLKQLSSADPEQIMTVMKEIAQLNEIKKVLSKELGERIILKM